jgi:hypothetical protein
MPPGRRRSPRSKDGTTASTGSASSSTSAGTGGIHDLSLDHLGSDEESHVLAYLGLAQGVLCLRLQRGCGGRGWGPDGLGRGVQARGSEGADCVCVDYTPAAHRTNSMSDIRAWLAGLGLPPLLEVTQGQPAQPDKARGADRAPPAHDHVLRPGGLHRDVAAARPRSPARADACLPGTRSSSPRPRSVWLVACSSAPILSRLWQNQGKKEKARRMLAEIYNWFTEGFGTADLKEAKNAARRAVAMKG